MKAVGVGRGWKQTPGSVPFHVFLRGMRIPWLVELLGAHTEVFGPLGSRVFPAMATLSNAYFPGCYLSSLSKWLCSFSFCQAEISTCGEQVSAGFCTYNGHRLLGC